MPLMPAADIDLNEPLVRRLLTEQFPDLAGLPLRLAANGWDNAIFRLGSNLAVRLPRREAAAHLIEHEQRWLPQLTRGLAMLTPTPVRCGTASSFFPWPWSVTPWIQGTTAAAQPLSARRAWAAELARFVDGLQQPAPGDAPFNPVRGVPLNTRDEHVRRRLAGGLVPRAREVDRLWSTLAALPPWEGPALWLHGDLHPANLVTQGGMLAAVIDFGDLTAGDPATDLAAAWLVFDAEGRRLFMEHLNARRDVATGTWQRARGWALVMATALLAHSDDNPAFRQLGLDVLSQVLDG
ncbi:aminoglycoside phosphotransferase family protein [Arthrobacter sp. VKM Ac-2550]|uniref:aminoglycoside phosphotransferase family protein n=1 Tax=Crystallibacter permensis TaxID=1938888 RepID=UPI002227EF02|nr:aminoglycoside phosphotransferase family protein [Arthrobacter sp. VKM Ac-2550]MCW2131382.1 putative kinase, aminoglycoside phosphotransferase (APT) family [Arthrobacter sp. VKM Ac-2550]